MRRRKSPTPDLRPDWRDPALPVYGKSGKAYPPDTMVRKAILTMRESTEPSWRNDPTYHLRRKPQL